jgi:hypothetical protein
MMSHSQILPNTWNGRRIYSIASRSFTAAHANDIWYGDVLHGSKALARRRQRKTYLVTLFDDASRLVPHSELCLAESALEIEGVLKQAVLKRGIWPL